MNRYASTGFLGDTLAHIPVHLLTLLLDNIMTIGLGHDIAVLLRDMLTGLQRY